jgi:hypothetical protein
VALPLLQIVRDPAAERDLRGYFGEGGARTYTGRRFEGLGGGGDRAETRDRITADDLVAIQMLSVRAPAEVAIGLLEGGLGVEISALLRQIPADAEMGLDGVLPLIVDGGPAETAWRILTKQDGVEWVIAGKLMARKRPALLPVYDGVVSCQLGEPKGFWVGLHESLRAGDGVLRRELDALRERAEIPATVSHLRVLDVVLWMRHEGAHVKRGCEGFGTVSLT